MPYYGTSRGMRAVVSWDKQNIYTLKGYWKNFHTFISEGKEYPILTNHMINPELGVEYYANIKYIESLDTWCAYQIMNSLSTVDDL